MKVPIQPRSCCYDDAAKQRQTRAVRRFFGAAMKRLPGFSGKVHFNPGGIAVWGETYLKLSLGDAPVIEAYDTSMGMLVRQWDGHHSGHNHYATTLDQFVAIVDRLAAQPFVRF